MKLRKKMCCCAKQQYFIWICSPLVRVVRSEGVRTIYNGSQMPPLLPQPESAILEALTQEYWQQARNYFEINYDGLWSDSDRANIWNTIQSFIELGLRWVGQKSRWGSCLWLTVRTWHQAQRAGLTSLSLLRETGPANWFYNKSCPCLPDSDRFIFLVL